MNNFSIKKNSYVIMDVTEALSIDFLCRREKF